MTLSVKPRPWQEIAVEITKEKNLDKAIKLARELLHALNPKEARETTTNGSAKGTAA